MECPFCAHANIEGADECQQCGQPLGDMHLSAPRTFVERGLLTDRVSELNPRKLFAVGHRTTVQQVLQLLVEKRIGCVTVVDDDQKTIGIFSERDCVVRLGPTFCDHLSRPICEFMTTDPQTLPADAKVAFALQRMDVGGYRHIPLVASNGAVTEIVSVRDILQYLTDRMPMSPS